MAAGARTAAAARSAASERSAASARTSAAARASILLQGLLGYWSLGEGAGLARYDQIGRQTLNCKVGTESTQAGVGGIGTALLLNGSTECLKLRQDLSFNFTQSIDAAAAAITQDLTLSCWASPSTLTFTGVKSIHSKQGGSAGQRSWHLDLGGTDQGAQQAGKWLFKVSVDGSNDKTAIGTTGVVSQWDHLLCWIDTAAQVIAISVNGAAAVTTALAGTVWWVNPLVPFLVGARNGTSPSSFFGGAIQHLAAWNRVLGSAEATFLYGGGTPPAFSTW